MKKPFYDAPPESPAVQALWVRLAELPLQLLRWVRARMQKTHPDAYIVKVMEWGGEAVTLDVTLPRGNMSFCLGGELAGLCKTQPGAYTLSLFCSPRVGESYACVKTWLFDADPVVPQHIKEELFQQIMSRILLEKI